MRHAPMCEVTCRAPFMKGTIKVDEFTERRARQIEAWHEHCHEAGHETEDSGTQYDSTIGYGFICGVTKISPRKRCTWTRTEARL